MPEETREQLEAQAARLEADARQIYGERGDAGLEAAAEKQTRARELRARATSLTLPTSSEGGVVSPTPTTTIPTPVTAPPAPTVGTCAAPVRSFDWNWKEFRLIIMLVVILILGIMAIQCARDQSENGRRQIQNWPGAPIQYGGGPPPIRVEGKIEVVTPQPQPAPSKRGESEVWREFMEDIRQGP